MVSKKGFYSILTGFFFVIILTVVIIGFVVWGLFNQSISSASSETMQEYESTKDIKNIIVSCLGNSFQNYFANSSIVCFEEEANIKGYNISFLNLSSLDSDCSIEYLGIKNITKIYNSRYKSKIVYLIDYYNLEFNTTCIAKLEVFI